MTALYVIRFVEARNPDWEQYVFGWIDGFACEYTKAKAWPFRLALATKVCAELNTKFSKVGTFTVEPIE